VFKRGCYSNLVAAEEFLQPSPVNGTASDDGILEKNIRKI
jgi:hypothetical protein